MTCLYTKMIRGNPPTTTHQSKKIVTIRKKGGGQFSKLADDKPLVEVRKHYAVMLAGSWHKEPITEPVVLVIEYHFPILKAASVAERQGGWMTSKPDLSNLTKTLEDALVDAGILIDDNLVVSQVVTKVRAVDPHIWISLWSVRDVPPKALLDYHNSSLEALSDADFGQHGLPLDDGGRTPVE